MIAVRRNIDKWSPSATATVTHESAQVSDWVAVEVDLAIRLNHELLVRIACSPVDCIDLAIGYLFSSSVIGGVSDIDTITFDSANSAIDVLAPDLGKFDRGLWRKKAVVTSGCGGSVARADVPPHTPRRAAPAIGQNTASILAAVKYARNVSEWHARTGCVHTGVLFAGNRIIVREDIGRHNAIDKVVGAGLQSGLPFESSILYCSGRSSSDMVLKAVRAGIPAMLSRSAPTSLAIDIADQAGTVLVGFARGDRFNVYTHRERLSAHDAISDRCAEEPEVCSKSFTNT